MVEHSNHPNQFFECVHTWKGDPDAFKSLDIDISMDGKITVNISDNTLEKVWDFKTKQVIHTTKKNYDCENFEFVILSPYKPELVICSCSEDYTITVWNWHNECEICTFKMDSYSLEYEWDHDHLYIPIINSVEVSYGGNLMFIKYDYHNIKYGGPVYSLSEVVNLETGEEYFILNGYSHDITWAISPNSKIIVSVNDDSSIIFWELTDIFPESKKESIKKWIKDKYGYNSVECGENVDTDEVISDLNLQTIQICRTIESNSSRVSSLAISPDEKLLIIGSDDRTIKVWDLQKGYVIYTMDEHSAKVSSLAISEDGKTLVSGSSDATIKIWSLPKGELIQTLEGHLTEVKFVAISTDGKTIFSQSDDNIIKAWQWKYSNEEEDFMEAKLINETNVMNQINELQTVRSKLDNILLAIESATKLECMDESMKQALKYQVRKIIWNDIIQPYLPNEWRISDRAMYLGYSPNRAQSIAIGKEAAKLYREKYSEDPPQSEEIVYGETRLINVYSGKALDLLDAAIRKVIEA